MPRRSPFVAALCAALAALPGAVSAAAADDFTLGGAAIRLQLEAGEFDSPEAVRQWIHRSAEIVAHYYGRFPVARLTVRVIAEPGGGVHGGKTWAHPDGFIRVQLGRAVSEAQLLADWVLVHEMTHLALPDTGEEHAWLSEGLATYVEGVERVQAG